MSIEWVQQNEARLMKLAFKLPSIAADAVCAVHKFRTAWDKVGGQVNKKPLKWLRLGAQKWPIGAQVARNWFHAKLFYYPPDELQKEGVEEEEDDWQVSEIVFN